MKIEWNKVTWYSRLGALVLFLLVVPLLTFYIGVEYQKNVDIFSLQNNSVAVISVAQHVSFSDSNQKVAGWTTYESNKYGFQISYPSNWTISTDIAAPTILFMALTDQKGDSSLNLQMGDTLGKQNIQSMGLEGNLKYIQDAQAKSGMQLGTEVPVQGGEAYETFITGGSEGSQQAHVAFLISKDHIYDITLTSSLDKNDEEILLKQVLATFKFTN